MNDISVMDGTIQRHWVKGIAANISVRSEFSSFIPTLQKYQLIGGTHFHIP